MSSSFTFAGLSRVGEGSFLIPSERHQPKQPTSFLSDASLGITRSLNLTGPFDCAIERSTGLGDPTIRAFEIDFDRMSRSPKEVVTAILIHELSHTAASVSARAQRNEGALFRVGLRFMGEDKDLHEIFEEVASLHNENTYLRSQGWREKEGERVVYHPPSSYAEDLLFKACYLDCTKGEEAVLSLLAGSQDTRNVLRSPLTTHLPYLSFEKEGAGYATKYQCILPSITQLSEEISDDQNLLDLLSKTQASGEFHSVAKTLHRAFGTAGLITLAHLPLNDRFREGDVFIDRETELLSIFARAGVLDKATKTLLRSCITRMIVARHALSLKPQTAIEVEIDTFLSSTPPRHQHDFYLDI